MSFSDILRDATHNVEGAVSASLVGLDGIVVETVQTDNAPDLVAVGAASANGHAPAGSSPIPAPAETEGVEVEVASMVAAVTRMARTGTAGDIREIIVDAEHQSYLIATIDAHYFLVIVTGPLANLGRARFELRRAAQKISTQF